MLQNAYVFSLIVGGVLLAASMFLGGDADADMDIDAGVDGDFDGHVDHQGDADVLGGFFGALTSLRFWTFFLAFFGLTGFLFSWLELLGEWPRFGVALATGLVVGYGIVSLFRRLQAGEHSIAAGVNDYVGKTGRVMVRIGDGNVGKVRIELKGTTVDILAETDDADALSTGQTVLVVQMRGTTAQVTRLETDSSDA